MPNPVRVHPDELVTTATVADLAKVDVATVNRWARTGRLPVALKVPTSVRGANLYRRADVDLLIQARIAELTEQLAALTA